MQELHTMIGLPVCAVLKDGTYRYGFIREVQNGHIVLQGFKGKKRLSKNRNKAKAQIKSFGGLGGMLGILGGGLGGIMGGMGGLGSMGGLAQNFLGSLGGGGLSSMGGLMKIGMGMMSFIMPLMGGFGI